jgi:MFS family permease
MAVLCIVVLSEPISFAILFPFVYFMVNGFGIEEGNIGYYVGFIASSFSFAQLLTSYFWGQLSDRFGRRPILLIGLMGNTVTTCLFGLSKSITWAICTRAACGLMNGNLGVAKSVLGEITNNKNRAAGFSLIGLSYGAGMIIGPSIGGLLSWPAKSFPSVFGSIQFFSDYPFFLPCFVSSLISAFGFGCGYFFLPETCHINSPSELVVNSDEQAPLLDRDETLVQFSDTSDAPFVPEGGIEQARDTPKRESGIGFNAIASVFSYSLLAFQDIVFDEIFPLWSAAKPTSGLGWTAVDIGLCLAIIGFIALICQLLIYPSLSERYPPLTLFRAPAILTMIIHPLFPLISTYSVDLKPWIWILMILAGGIKTILSNISFTAGMILVYYR